ncbi:DUF3466 family protein [Psychrobium sp. 1_MG-2023]|uniref:DUF3466 family protein n=1 Tax=Psychrobium sp. 1_MG-2023 TaxID=3062624 RepID=UPI000C324DBF|nr:DUF3466 family protein [Psychrobium sp. 1_MG-2023]MDP2560350.1 DUF3466 family protein [Psychrobium sp. 1_MG-2023]PKF55459.1 hypothetical protein CW748_13270 [Alteromonadales bacterium alter-6D02]
MNNKLQPSLIAAALLASFSANATVYKIENIDEFYKVNGTVENSRSGFGATLNDNSKYIGGASGKFAPQLSDDDENLITNNRVDVALAQQSTSTSVYRSPKFIPNAQSIIFEYDLDNMPSFIRIFEESITDDSIDPDEYVSVNTHAFDVNNTNVIVGTTSSASFAIADPVQDEDNADREFPFYAYEYAQRAMIVDNGTLHTFEPSFNTYGGQSALTGINDSGRVVGYESVGLERLTEERIDSRCLDSYKDHIPLAVCTGGFSFEGRRNEPALFYLEAVSWQYEDGKLTDRKPLGILAQPVNDDDNYSYNSIALDVNNNDIAVGRSIAFRDGKEEIRYRFNVATVFKDGEIIDLMDHSQDDWPGSAATAINNNDLVVGYVTKYFSGYKRDKFFIYDVNGEESAVSFPNDFSDGETDFATNPNDINDNNVVVGSVEIDTVKTSSGRRTHGFLYEHNEEKFTDLNDILTCESKGYVQQEGEWAKYQVEASGGDGQRISYDADIVVVSANSISNDGEIMATALVTLPRIKTQWVDEEGNIVDPGTEDAQEEIVVDENGEPVFDTDADGKPVTEQIPRAVILKPTEGEACSVIDEDSQEHKHTRSGAGLGFGALMLGLFGFVTRRLMRK